jgi:hypothetical protein
VGACGSIVVKALSYKETRYGEGISSVYLILPTEPGLWVYSASNRNEYQKQKIVFGE